MAPAKLAAIRAKTTPAKATRTKPPRTKPPGRSLFDDFLPHLIARLAHELNGDLIEKLKQEGINITRWRVLAVLAMGEGITITEIIDRAMMQQSALSRALMNMVREGYVRRAAHRRDARCAEVYLTEKGRALFNSLNVVVRRRERRLLAGFSQRQEAAAFTLIRRLGRNMSR
jgi:DNA-binding MarR family transcriptional regulator